MVHHRSFAMPACTQRVLRSQFHSIAPRNRPQWLRDMRPFIEANGHEG